MEPYERLAAMVLDKLRINVILIALLVSWLIANFGHNLIGLLAKDTDGRLIIPLLSMLIGVGVGGLIAAMIRMFESPQVPADVHERMVKTLTENVRRTYE